MKEEKNMFVSAQHLCSITVQAIGIYVYGAGGYVSDLMRFPPAGGRKNAALWLGQPPWSCDRKQQAGSWRKTQEDPELRASWS